MTWTSEAGQSFDLLNSLDLLNWSNLVENIPAILSSNQTSYTVPVDKTDEAQFFRVKRAFATMDEQKKREAMRAFYAGFSHMDGQLGLAMNAVEEKGLLENTVIMFMGDNGYQVGEKNDWNKGHLFGRSCRAPLITVMPGHACRRRKL